MNKLYRRLAFTNIKNNKQFYLPYILTSIMSVILFYCMNAMSTNEGFKSVRGGRNVLDVLKLGNIVIGIFVVIFLFYTNSFIIKRRKKELGVYNILGMEKRHIAKVLLWETSFSYAISVVAGLITGITFNKLFSMILYKITGLEESIPFYISKVGCIATVILFAGIFLANYIFNLLQVKLANPIELLHSSNSGEKEPKTKWILTIIGVVSLGAGYYIALTTGNPVKAIFVFFGAVVLVIIGTYALFTAGSIALLKVLRNNKKFYYQTRHFTAVSGMIYRMKQNAVGLGNICILSTMVLVMISTTVSMYAGLDDTTRGMCPQTIMVDFEFYGVPSREDVEKIDSLIKECIENKGRTIKYSTDALEYNIIGIENDGVIKSISSFDTAQDVSKEYDIDFITRREYELKNDVSIEPLGKDEVKIYSNNGYDSTLFDFHGMQFKVVSSELIKTSVKSTGFQALLDSMIKGTLIVVVEDDSVLTSLYEANKADYNVNAIPPLQHIQYSVGYDIDGTRQEQSQVGAYINEVISSLNHNEICENLEFSCKEVTARAEIYKEYMSMHGGIFFLGLFLGSMFLMITVLIIYYKQISEGYDDRERFAIMQKVGMSNDEVKASIRTQIRTVFFLPLVTATLHLAVAFPILNKILKLMNLYNTGLFLKCMALTVLAFAVIYFAVFKLTSKSYYKIVGNQV